MSISIESGQIIAPWEFEKVCVTILREKPMLSCLLVQMIAECSMFGHNWVRCIDVYKRLNRDTTNEGVGKLLSLTLISKTISIKKEKIHSALDAYYISLSTNVDTVNINSPDGVIMLKIINVIKAFTKKYPNVTSFLPLILLCIYRFKYKRTNEITEYLGLTLSNPCRVPRIVNNLAEFGVVVTESINGGPRSKLKPR